MKPCIYLRSVSQKLALGKYKGDVDFELLGIQSTPEKKEREERSVFSGVTTQNAHHRILEPCAVHRHLGSYRPKLVSVVCSDPVSRSPPTSHRLPLCPLDCRACLWHNPLSSQWSFSFSLSLVKRCCAPLLFTDITEPVGGVFSLTLLSAFKFCPFSLPQSLLCFGLLN